MYDVSISWVCRPVADETDFSWLSFFKNAGIPDDDAVQ